MTTSPATWWRRRSLRARLTVASTAVIAVGVAAAATILVWRLQTSLLANLDSTVVQQAQNVAATVHTGRTSVALTESGDTSLAQVVSADGSVLAASANIEGEPPLFDIRPTSTTPAVRDSTVTQLGTDGRYRVATMLTTAPGGAAVYVARSTAEITTSVDNLMFALVVGAPLTVLALAVLGWWLVGRALRPVEIMRRQAGAIPGTDGRTRLALPPTRDELARLAATFNALLDRIDDARHRQRQFVADAAHELRSPIASLRAQLDIEAGHPALPADRLALAGDAERLSHLVDDLLVLARLDAAPVLRRDQVDLDDLVLAEVRRVRSRAACEIDAGGVSAGRVLGDAGALDRVVRNVLDNAARHATARVTVAVRTERNGVTLTVADDGPGIAPGDRLRVFDRFVRLDADRTRAVGGTGLGLAIVRDVVTAQHGTVHIEDNEPGVRVVITLPGALEP